MDDLRLFSRDYVLLDQKSDVVIVFGLDVFGPFEARVF